MVQKVITSIDFIKKFLTVLSIIGKKITSSTQRTKYTQNKERLDVEEQLEDQAGSVSTDEDESITAVNIHLYFLSKLHLFTYSIILL